MLTEIHPKLPMRDKAATKKFYEKLVQDDFPRCFVFSFDSIYSA